MFHNSFFSDLKLLIIELFDGMQNTVVQRITITF